MIARRPVEIVDSLIDVGNWASVLGRPFQQPEDDSGLGAWARMTNLHS